MHYDTRHPSREGERERENIDQKAIKEIEICMFPILFMQEKAAAAIAKHISLNRAKQKQQTTTTKKTREKKTHEKQKENTITASPLPLTAVQSSTRFSYSCEHLPRAWKLLAQKWTIFKKEKKIQTDSLAHRENDKHETQIMNWFMIFCWPVYL